MSDYPDYTQGVSIDAVTIASIPIDIVAQTVGNIAIDIAAQTMGNVDVNIAASAVTIDVDISAQSLDTVAMSVKMGIPTSNLGQLVNPDFEDFFGSGASVYAVGWIDYLGCHRIRTGAFSGFRCITLKKLTPAAFNGLVQSFSPAIPTDNIAAFTIQALNGEDADGTFKIDLTYSDGTTTTQTITATAMSDWTSKTITYTASKYITAIRIYTDHATFANFDALYLDTVALRYREELQGIINTVDVDITAQTVGNLTVDISAQSIGNLDVNIAASAVTLNVDVTASVAINIQTSGGVNIIIDKLTQTAYTERRFIVYNDNDVTTPDAPPSNLTATTYRGKYFPRGCRGFISQARIYCKRTGSGTLTLAFSPQIGISEVFTADVTPGADWDWKIGSVLRPWNYDSMFIWVKSCSADVSYGYDETEPYDDWTSSDSGATWDSDNRRYFIRAYYRAATVGDVPVSGTLNTIEIPSTSSGAASGNIDVPDSTLTSIVTVTGSGHIDRISIYTEHDDVEISLYVDGTELTEGALLSGSVLCAASLNAAGYSDSTPQIQLLLFTDGSHCEYAVTIPFKFKRTFEIKAYHETGANKLVNCGIVYTPLR